MAFAGLRTVVRRLPLPVAQVLGSVLGYAFYAASPRYRQLIWQHLRIAFGSALTAKVRYRIARGVCTNLGRTVMEWFVFERLSCAQLRDLVEVHGLHHLQAAFAKGRGVIGLSAHFGNWELLPMTVAGLGCQGGVLARALRYPEYADFIRTLRERKGVTTYARGSVKEVARLLRRNHIVGMLVDQDVDSLEGVFVDFFGRPAYTVAGPAALSMMTGAALLPCFVVRVGRRFRIMFEEPLAVPRSGDRARDVAAITQAWSRVVESYIRCYPEQWVWMHRRWKTTPASVQERARRAAAAGASA
jgi:KDO2-lipid IV(A) lauroyltransferase